MLFGVIAAIIHFYKIPKIIKTLNIRLIRILIWSLMIWSLFFVKGDIEPFKIMHGILFAILILMVTQKGKRLFNLERSPFVYLGTISYGIYIYHPFLSYVLRWSMEVSDTIMFIVVKSPIVYYALEILLTILIAHFSFQYYESKFLKLKARYVFSSAPKK